MSKRTPEQELRMKQAIDDSRLAFMAEVLGSDSIPQEDYARLKAAGKIRETSSRPTTDTATVKQVRDALFGENSATDEVTSRSGDGYTIIVAPNAPTTEFEREAAKLARSRIGQRLRGLGNKLDPATGLPGKELVVVRREVARGIEERRTASEIATKIQRATRNPKRDWVEVAYNELQNSFEEAKALAFSKNMPPGYDPLVYKRPRPDACRFCVLLYLGPDKKTPRLFKLSELMANGTNVDRHANSSSEAGNDDHDDDHGDDDDGDLWLAVVGVTHSRCSCTLHHMPEDMAFNSDGQMIYAPRHGRE
jgi:hypothetical protein